MEAVVRPQDDLWRHVNGRWLENTSIPADRTQYGVTQELSDRVQGNLHELIEATRYCDSRCDRSTLQVRDFYASFMDEPALEQLGLRPLESELSRIASVVDRRQLGTLFARLGTIGVNNPIVMFISPDDQNPTRYVPFFTQGGLTLPTRDYYLNASNERFVALREKQVRYHASLLRLSGTSSEAALEDAKAILELEVEIAKIQWSPVENRNPVKTYNLVRTDELPLFVSEIDWSDYLRERKLIDKVTEVVVRQPSYFRVLNSLISSFPLETWKNYARVHLMSEYSQYLSKEFVDGRFAFFDSAVFGRVKSTPRWERGVRLLNRHLRDSVGKLYVKTYFSDAAKTRVAQMVMTILVEYGKSIVECSWLHPKTREHALDKLSKLNVKLGYPKKWIDYGAVTVEPNHLVENVMRARIFEDARNAVKIGGAVDRDEWLVASQTVNAYYNPLLNEIVIPAAYIQPPYFDLAVDDASNYGSIGTTIGHEISHAFDDQGSLYDSTGRLRTWWTPDDRQRFIAKTKMLATQYSTFEVLPNVYIDGNLTVGENIADIAGLEIAYKSYQASLRNRQSRKNKGMSKSQRFFYSYAQSWREQTRPEVLLAQTKSDPHAPNEFRVNGVVRNSRFFYSTFGVKPSDKMFLPYRDRVSLW